MLAADGEGIVADGGNVMWDLRPMHVPSATDGIVTKRLEMLAEDDAPVAVAAAATAVGNGAPVGDAPTRAESGARCYKWFAAVLDKRRMMMLC